MSNMAAVAVQEKPPVGTSVMFCYKGLLYPAIVKRHCGMDFFFIEFIERQPSDDFPKECSGTGGWHVSLRGKGKSWY